MKYWIERWSQLRQKELISYPNEFPIHDVYKTLCAHEEIKSGFKELHEILMHCYDDILNDPAGMLLSIYDMDEYDYFSKEARASREESYKYAKVFYALGYSGELKQSGELCIHADKLKEQCKALRITNIGAFLHKLGDYGIIAEGLVNGKIKSNTSIMISYPDNKNVITVLYILAVKSKNTGRYKDFCRLNYKLLESDWSTIEYGNSVDAVSDLFHSEQDRTAAQLIHEELINRNYYYNFQEWNEGPQIRYYKKESDRDRNTNASFWITSMDTELKFYFRITNMDRVLEYITSSPESVINNFLSSDNGCANRFSGKCVSGLSYQLNGSTIWRCGCCNPNFQVTPSVDDYLYYINAVEMAGNKK
ncbi:MAG: hypothetical protein K2J99_13910 [Lachnospiraceae bacterium]|nr:hypothetical protein [Lachnospiraceae bacterium]